MTIKEIIIYIKIFLLLAPLLTKNLGKKIITAIQIRVKIMWLELERLRSIILYIILLQLRFEVFQ